MPIETAQRPDMKEADTVDRTVPRRRADDQWGARAPVAEREPELQADLVAIRERVLVDPRWVREHLDDDRVRLLDVSSDPEVYAQGHLPGARFIHWRDDLTARHGPVGGQVLSREALARALGARGITEDDTIVLYDDCLGVYAARAYWVLKYYGHEDVRLLEGGRAAWEQEGEELTTVERPDEPTVYVARATNRAIRAEWREVIDRLQDPGTRYLDVRTAMEYTGHQPPTSRGGHVPGAVNVNWAHAIGDDGRLRPTEELERLYRRAGIGPEHDIIVYSMIGVRSSHAWFVLHELLGYPAVANYDGSWQEYSSIRSSPFER
jgi:thiosulfate/3-mercaptopyruvate sulfurtransferase